jgi:hydroxyacylglutathione hydrolase
MQSQELLRRIKINKSPVILDVRTGFEFHNGHIAGAIHAPAWKILFRLAKVPSDKKTELVVTCEHGPRAELAKSLLGLIGYRNVTLLDGHMSAWRRSGNPFEN